jgi:8-amino-7-oxononanoate synthase
MQQAPELTATLKTRGRLFLKLAQEAGINTGSSSGLAIVPAITGSSLTAARLAETLFEQGINVQPIIYPAVPEKSARLRFFISCLHTEEQIRQTVAILAKEI